MSRLYKSVRCVIFTFIIPCNRFYDIKRLYLAFNQFQRAKCVKGKKLFLVFDTYAYLRFINNISEQFAEVVTKKEKNMMNSSVTLNRKT